VRQLRDATIQELLGEVRFLPRCYKDVKTEAEEAAALEAVTRQQPVKIQQNEKI
jgi:hypothetical protein